VRLEFAATAVERPGVVDAVLDMEMSDMVVSIGVNSWEDL